MRQGGVSNRAMREFTSAYCLYTECIQAPHLVQKIPAANDVKPFVETYIKSSILLGLYSFR